MNNSQVAHAWAHGRTGKGSNLRSDGTMLTSYYTTIAARIDDVIYISADNMSMSTSKHLNHARQAVNHEREKIFYTHAFSWSGSNPALTHEAMILPEVRHIIQELETALNSSRARQVTKMKAIDEYNQKKNQIIELAGRVGVKLPDMPEVQNNPEAVKEYQEKARIAAEKREAARLEAQKKQQREDKKQLNRWLTTGAGYFPQSFAIRGADQITIKKGYVTHRDQAQFSEKVNTEVLKVVTSQGAECPLDHAVKALRFWQSRYIGAMESFTKRGADKFTPYQTNGHKIPLGIFTLDSIDESGTVRAGCHTFTREEIERFINQWREVLGL